MEAIHCIGDSHVSFFSGTDRLVPAWPERSVDRLPFFRTYRVGPALAWSLGHPGTTARGREQTEEILRTAVPPGSPVLFLFGEIDCRYHLLKQAEKQGREVSELAGECAEAYSAAATVLAGEGRPVLFCSPPASTPENREGAEETFPTAGSGAKRNAATRAFNDRLRERCAERKIPFVDFLDALVGPDGATRMGLYRDPIHLSQRAMPLALAALRRAWPDCDARLPFSYRAQLALSRLTGMKVR